VHRIWIRTIGRDVGGHWRTVSVCFLTMTFYPQANSTIDSSTCTRWTFNGKSSCAPSLTNHTD
jgi:hypothetical protein